MENLTKEQMKEKIESLREQAEKFKREAYELERKMILEGLNLKIGTWYASTDNSSDKDFVFLTSVNSDSLYGYSISLDNHDGIYIDDYTWYTYNEIKNYVPCTIEDVKLAINEYAANTLIPNLDKLKIK